MKAFVERWGDSLAVRLPESFAAEARIESGTIVDVRFEGGTIVMSAARHQTPTLEDLLGQITDENIHGEVDWGPPVGKEVW